MDIHQLEIMKNTIAIVAIATVLPFLQGCGGGNTAAGGEGEEQTRYASNLSMRERPDGIEIVTVRNPWDTTKTLATYALVEKDEKPGSPLPAGAVRIDVPLRRSVVYSGVHLSLINELGAGEALNGACDVEYISDAGVKRMVEEGRIENCGTSNSPNMEKIIRLIPGAVILSPFENSNNAARYSATGIPVVEAADYLEATPLGRAEWMRFYGRLYGRSEQADSLFAKVEREYNKIKEQAGKAKERPLVMNDMIYGNVWNVPTSGSVTGRMFADAGARNPFENQTNAGSAHLSPEEVLYKAQDSDIWLLRYFSPNEMTLADVGKENPIYTKFAPYKSGNVYGANTMKCTIFDDGAFHPQYVLLEYAKIFHPEIFKGELRYYKKLK